MNWRTELEKRNKDWGPRICRQNKRNAATEEKKGAGLFNRIPTQHPGLSRKTEMGSEWLTNVSKVTQLVKGQKQGLNPGVVGICPLKLC